MDLATLRTVITHAGGESHVAGFIFDNSARQFFDVQEFVLDDHLVPGTEILWFDEVDTHNNKYKVYKHVETIQTVLTVEDPALVGKIDTRYMGG